MNGTVNVWLDMTAKASRITIPNLQLLQIAKVKPELEKMGLQVECYYTYGDLPQGTIVTQNPAAGAKVFSGSQITLVISYGKNDSTERLIVPGVVGLSYDMAIEILNIKGFDRIKKLPSPDRNLRSPSQVLVIAQIPSKDAAVDRDTEIFLEVG
jgi:beta-lactam-binding protein with PASTA domain